MAEKKIGTKAKKKIKKGFFEVEVPLTAAVVKLYAGDAGELDGRTVKLDLTKSLRGKSLELKLKVKAEEGKLKGEPMSLVLVGSYVRRMMRKGADYVEDSFDTNCRDMKVRVKPFLITRKKVSRAVRGVLREGARKYLVGYFKTRNVRELFNEIINNKLQKSLSLKLKKIYPLALCEIRWFEVVGERDAVEEEFEDEEEKEEIR